MKCVICGHQSKYRCKYCARCQKLIRRYPKAVRRDALKAAWSKELDAFLCYYTKLKLDEKDARNPFHMVWDHRTPDDIKTLVPTTAFINQLKCAMTEDEFDRFIPMLSDHLENGTPFDKDAFELAHYHPIKATIAYIDARPEPIRIWHTDVCLICGKEPMKDGLYCARCGKVMARIHDNANYRMALKTAYDKEVDGFRCHYTGLIVDLEDANSPWHVSIDHRFPGKSGNTVIAANLINNMKNALSEDEFIIIVKNLARHFRTREPFDLDGVKFEYWDHPKRTAE